MSKSVIHKLYNNIQNPVVILKYLSFKGLTAWIPDRVYVSLIYRSKFGKKLNLDHPVTFNEKLQWLKLYDRNPAYHVMADKYDAKEFFKKTIGEKYVIPTIGVWTSPDDINIDELPDAFVLKTTHDSGGVVICKDKSDFDFVAAKHKLKTRQKLNYYLSEREWAYKGLKPRIIAEQYLHSFDRGGIIEYKIFCFNGVPTLFLVCMGGAHGIGRTNDFYDADFNHIPVTVTWPNAEEKILKPKEYDELMYIAKKLSAGIPQVRVDTYVADGIIYIGEMTFCHDSGACHFKPEKYDEIFGGYIVLPERGV